VKTALALISMALFVLACSAPVGTIGVGNPSLSEDRARELAQESIEAFSNCDHERWIAHWADSLKAEADAVTFGPYCNGYVLAHGDFEGIAAIEHVPAETAGYVRWDVTAKFGTGNVVFSFVIRADGEEIEGYVIDPPR
jgi:hypothetical protein